jgi:prolyl 4-hydroxylase
MQTQSSTKSAGEQRPQYISVELRQWIVAQAQAGVAPESVLEAMKASGWHEDVAIKALEETLRDHLTKHAAAQAAAPSNHEPQPVPVPDAPLADSPSKIRILDRDVTVLMTMKHPRIIVLGGFLSDDECDKMVALAGPRMARSETVDNLTGGSEVNVARTSRGMFFERGETGVIDRVEKRIAALLDWPVQNGEGLQVLHYPTGAGSEPHFDYLQPGNAANRESIARSGQRVSTLVTYLNDVPAGGQTIFPALGWAVSPLRGNAVYFEYADDRGAVDARSLHASAPVTQGEKWVVTKWMRQRRFVSA